MRIKMIDGFVARCEAKGVQRDVSLFMLQHEDNHLSSVWPAAEKNFEY